MPAASARARVLVISRNLPPLTGGMERLSQHLVAALASEHDVTVIGPPGAAAHVDDRVRCIDCARHTPAAFLLEALLRALLHALGSRRPTLVVATSGLTAPIAWLAARLAGARQLTLVHGLDLVVPHALYQWLFLPAIRAADRIVANSANTARLATERGVAASRVQVIHPGVAWPERLPSAAAWRIRNGLGDRPLLLAVGRLAARKGLPEFVERALPALVAAIPDLLLVVIGEEARDAIRRETSVGARLRAALAASGMQGHAWLRGGASDEEVREACCAAQVFVFPLVEVAGDVEGFGMVAAEAAACGLRSVAFDLGGVADAVVPGVTGTLVEPGDYEAFVAACRQELEMAADGRRREACRAAAQQFAWPRFEREVLDLCRRLCNEDPR